MFKPINEAHAIAEVVVFFEFSPDLAKVLPLPGLRAKLEEKFPRIDELKEMRVDIASDGAISMRQLNSGHQLIRFRANGTPEWQINVGPSAVSFHCLDYTRWVAVWAEMREYVKVVFHEIGAATTSISSVGLKYVDRFVWTPMGDAYDASELFNIKSKWLHRASFSSSSRWHCHTGWFEIDNEVGELLNQLNIDSANAIVDGAPIVLVTVDHTQTLRRQAEGALDKYGNVFGAKSSAIDDLLKRLHDGNKNMLRDLLNARMATLIKLDGDAK